MVLTIDRRGCNGMGFKQVLVAIAEWVSKYQCCQKFKYWCKYWQGWVVAKVCMYIVPKKELLGLFGGWRQKF